MAQHPTGTTPIAVWQIASTVYDEQGAKDHEATIRITAQMVQDVSQVCWSGEPSRYAAAWGPDDWKGASFLPIPRGALLAAISKIARCHEIRAKIGVWDGGVMIAQAHVDTVAVFLRTTGLTQFYDRAKAPVQLLDAGTDPSSGNSCVRAVYAAVEPESVCMICTRGTVGAQCVARAAGSILGSHVVGREDTAFHPRSRKYDTMVILQVHSRDGRSNASLIKALKEQSSRDG